MLFSNKKGYLQIDFFFVALFFFLLFTILYTAHINQSEAYEKIIEQETLQKTSQDICSLLISQPGMPNNWDGNFSTTNYLGLKSTQEKYLDSNKVTGFFNSSRYGSIVDIFDITGVLYVSLSNYQSGSELYSIGETSGSSSQVGRSICFAQFNNQEVKLLVEVWR